MQDLTNYGDQELVLICENTEFLYDVMQDLIFDELLFTLNEIYVYSDDQLKELKIHFNELVDDKNGSQERMPADLQGNYQHAI